MGRIKVLLTSVVVAVAMLVALSGPALAHGLFALDDGFVDRDRCCRHHLVGDRFFDRDDLLLLRCDVEDVDRFGNIILVEVDCD
jgi:hypothetical protein